MSFSEVMFYENYLTSDFHTNTTRQNGVENRDKADYLTRQWHGSGFKRRILIIQSRQILKYRNT